MVNGHFRVGEGVRVCVGVKVGVVVITVAVPVREGVIGAAVAVRFPEAATQPARPGTSNAQKINSRNDIGLIPPFIIQSPIRGVKNRTADSTKRTGQSRVDGIEKDGFC